MNTILKSAAFTLTLILIGTLNATQTISLIDQILFNAIKNDKSGGKFVILAVEEGADLNARDDGGFSTLQQAALQGDKDIVRYILRNVDRKQALTDNQNKLGLTAFELAQLAGHTSLAGDLEFFLNHENSPVPYCYKNNKGGITCVTVSASN